MNNKLLGRAGENMVVSYLIAKGHEILEQSYRCRTGEIDIISLYGNCIHFVEVKTRSGVQYGSPKEAVTRDKLRHIYNTAGVYIKGLEARAREKSVYMPKFSYSIDVVEVLINHIEGVE